MPSGPRRDGPPRKRSIGPLVIVTVVAAVGLTLLLIRLFSWGPSSSESARENSAQPGISQPSVVQDPSVEEPADGPANGSADGLAADAAARQFVQEVDGLLTEAGAGRSAVQQAVNDTELCRDPASAATVLDQMADQRAGLADRARRLDPTAVAEGAAVSNLLAEAWQASADADRAFAEWARAAVGCTGPPGHDAAYQRGLDHSVTATSRKTSFTELWNPLAARFGLASRTHTQL